MAAKQLVVLGDQTAIVTQKGQINSVANSEQWEQIFVNPATDPEDVVMIRMDANVNSYGQVLIELIDKDDVVQARHRYPISEFPGIEVEWIDGASQSLSSLSPVLGSNEFETGTVRFTLSGKIDFSPAAYMWFGTEALPIGGMNMGGSGHFVFEIPFRLEDVPVES